MRILTETQVAALVAINDLNDTERYIAGIKQAIDARIGKSSCMSTLVSSLANLETRKLVKSKTGKPSAGRGGKPKRFYSVTKLGETKLAETKAHWQKIVS